MKKIIQIVSIVFGILLLPQTFAASIAGNWTTIDDVTGQKRAIVHINVSGDSASGTIVQIFPQPGDTGICSKCPGAFKGKPIKGMTFLWGLKKSGDNVWEGGKILDPKNGKIYRAKVTLQGNSLLVRGYVGFSVLGRTQTWRR